MRSPILRACTLAAALALGAGVLSASPAGAVGPNPNQTITDSLAPPAVAAALVGAGVAVSNVQFAGSPVSIGSFSFTDPAVVGFGSGVMLGTGRVADAAGPNTYDDVTTAFWGAGDADLDALVSGNTYDATVLEFDFVPVANQVVFNYVFGSDEYEEWVGSPYNDVFAFLVNGVNCATVRAVAGDPASAFVPVAVNTIDQLARPDLYRANYPFATATIDTEMDGLTNVLTCKAAVTAGATNHMKLAIADRADPYYDSNVFLAAGSLVSNENPVAEISVEPESGDAPLPVKAAIEGSDPNDVPLAYSIDWGDGSSPDTGSLPDETAVVDHTYTVPGDYTAVLTVSNGTVTGTASEGVHVGGVTPPTDTTPPDLAPTFSATQPFALGSSVTASPNATDASGIASQSCGPVSTAAVGAFTVTCTATDIYGNSASVDVPYTVGYAVANLQPLAGSEYRSHFTIPVSFQLADGGGLLSDAVANGLRESISVWMDGIAPMHPRYDKRTDTFSVLLRRDKSVPGPYLIHIDLTVGGSVVTLAAIPVTIVP